MLECEGYKIFKGTLMVTPKSGLDPFEVKGTCLYKPECDCWYVNGSSYPAKICCVWEDEEDKENFQAITRENTQCMN